MLQAGFRTQNLSAELAFGGPEIAPRQSHLVPGRAGSPPASQRAQENQRCFHLEVLISNAGWISRTIVPETNPGSLGGTKPLHMLWMSLGCLPQACGHAHTQCDYTWAPRRPTSLACVLHPRLPRLANISLALLAATYGTMGHDIVQQHVP